VGAALAMEPADVACPLIRDMGVHLVRGVTVAEMFRHYLGKAGGPMEGRDGNIHLGAYSRGTIPMISHLPEMLPVRLLDRPNEVKPVAGFPHPHVAVGCAAVVHHLLPAGPTHSYSSKTPSVDAGSRSIRA
jgi:hypothetical protein